jgi:hypothetical protein
VKGLLILLLAALVLCSLSISSVCKTRIFEVDLKIVRHQLVDCTVSGSVTNIGGITAQDVKVYAKFTDGSGDRIGEKLSYSIDELRGEESADFWITVPREMCDLIAEYEVWPSSEAEE